MIPANYPLPWRSETRRNRNGARVVIIDADNNEVSQTMGETTGEAECIAAAIVATCNATMPIASPKVTP